MICTSSYRSHLCHLEIDHNLLLQSLQAELAAAQLEKQCLLEQANSAAALAAADQQSAYREVTIQAEWPAARKQLSRAGSLPPKGPVTSSCASLVSSKQPPLRSLSWGSSSRSHAKQEPPQRQSSFNASQASGEPDHSQQQLLQQQQPSQQGAPYAVIERWMSQEQLPSPAASEVVGSDAVRQEVLQEVLQAVAMNSNSASSVNFNSLTVKVSKAACFCLHAAGFTHITQRLWPLMLLSNQTAHTPLLESNPMPCQDPGIVQSMVCACW